MSIPAVAIRNPVFAWMLMLGFIVFGAIAFFRLGVGQYPDVDVPVINVRVDLEGAAPEVMESEVLDILEDAVMAVEGVKNISATAMLGRAELTVEFNIERNIDLAMQDVQARVSAAQRNLPPDMDPPVISKTNPDDRPIMWVALTGPRSPQELADYARNLLRDRFLTVPGNGDVRMGGYLERNVRLWIDPEKLNARNLTIGEVVATIQRQHVEAPAGRIESKNREANVRVEGEALSIEEWKKLVVSERDGSPVYLEDVALVEDGFEDRRRLSRINGMPAQGLGIIKQHGANTVAVAEACHERVAELNQTLPEDLTLSVRFDSSTYIRSAIYETEETLVLAVMLTALVCWLFLGSLSSTFNVVLAIPVSVLGTFAVMYFCGFTLNTFTLLALTLSIGIVVDDAVMVLENIYRHAEMGKDRLAAAKEGSEQISFAALAATLAIIAIFLPVAFMYGVIGEFFFEFGVVLSVAVAISLLEALTLAPSRCAQFLSVGQRNNFIERAVGWSLDKLAQVYAWTLGYSLRWRFATLAVSGLLFAGSLLPISGYVGLKQDWVPQLPSEMAPPQDQGIFMLSVRTPVGSSIDYTDKVVLEVERIMAGRDEIAGVYAIVGGFDGMANQANMFITMKPIEERTISQQQSIDELRKALNIFPGTTVFPIDFSRQSLPGVRSSRSAVEFTVRGPSWEKLGQLSQQFTDAMTDSGALVDVDTSYRVGMPEVSVTPRRDRLMALNVDTKEVSDAISALVGGNRIAKFTDNGRRYDVRVRLLRDDRVRPEDIGRIYVRNREGAPVQLGELVDITLRPSLQEITRENRERAIKLTANNAPGTSQADAMAAVFKIRDELLPPGYNLVLSGQSQLFEEAKWNLVFALIMGILVAYMVLASQFNSFLHPFTVLLTLPFAVSGALFALTLSGLSLNMYSMIGVILLMGIVKKNGILLVDFTNQARDEGMSCDEALRHACPIRLRPILMTSVATIAGALPGAIATGAGAELRVPMSITVIGGMIVSTVLTLFVIPCFYSLADQGRTVIYHAMGWDKEQAPLHAAHAQPQHSGAGD